MSGKRSISNIALQGVGRGGVLLWAAWTLAGCGYVFKGTRINEKLEAEKVETIFVETFRNDSYRPGIESTVYNQMLKALTYATSLRVVNRLEDADAVLKGVVASADSSVQTTALSKDTFPKGTSTYRDKVSIASAYVASLSASFTLVRTRRNGGKGDVLWGGGFARARPYPGNNYMGIFGSTSHLINETEFDRALAEAAADLAVDATENLFSAF